MSRLNGPVLILSLGIAVVRPLAAQATRQCADAGGQQPANLCFARVADSLETKLDSLLADLRSALPPPAFARLRGAENHWRASRDSLCAWEHDLFFGGSIAPQVAAQCRIALTAQRIATLKVFLCPGAPVMPECAESHRYDALPEP